jgi:hypothetical protein
MEPHMQLMGESHLSDHEPKFELDPSLAFHEKKSLSEIRMLDANDKLSHDEISRAIKIHLQPDLEGEKAPNAEEVAEAYKMLEIHAKKVKN